MKEAGEEEEHLGLGQGLAQAPPLAQAERDNFGVLDELARLVQKPGMELGLYWLISANQKATQDGPWF